MRSVHPRRITLLVSSLGGGGAERVAATLANAWVARGDHVSVIPTHLADEAPGYHLRPEVQLKPLRSFVTPTGVLQPLRKWHALRNLVRSLSPDIVVSLLTNVNVNAILALSGLKIPLVVSERVDLAGSVELPKTLRLARRLLYQFADILVVQTEEAACRYREEIIRPPQMVVIPNPLPVELEASALRAHVGTSGGRVVGMGRLAPQKRFDSLIHAFARAFSNDPAWQLTIWGEGPLRASLQQLIDGLGLSGRAQLQGRAVDAWSALASGHIFALSSEYEGFPNAMLEAMALGVPCVAFDCPSGPRELGAGGTAAILVAPGDVGSFANALQALAADPERRVRLGHLAAHSVRERFSESQVIGRWQALFEQLVSRHRR